MALDGFGQAADRPARSPANGNLSPSARIRAWLARGLDQPGGKLPLFDTEGQQVEREMVRTALEAGWAEPWFSNPIAPDWIVCKLTETGRRHALCGAEDAEA